MLFIFIIIYVLVVSFGVKKDPETKWLENVGAGEAVKHIRYYVFLLHFLEG